MAMALRFDNPHVLARMRQRNVTEDQAQACVACGSCTENGARCVYELNGLKVVVNRRTKQVVTVMTTDVHLLPGGNRLDLVHYNRLARDLGVHVWYDDQAGHHELYGSPERVLNAIRYIERAACRM